MKFICGYCLCIMIEEKHPKRVLAEIINLLGLRDTFDWKVVRNILYQSVLTSNKIIIIYLERQPYMVKSSSTHFLFSLSLSLSLFYLDLTSIVIIIYKLNTTLKVNRSFIMFWYLMVKVNQLMHCLQVLLMDAELE